MNKQFLIFLFFLVLSGLFWLMMTFNNTYEQEYPVKLQLVGVPDNVVVTTDLPDTVRVTIRDNGFQLISYLTSHKLKPVNVSFNAYANKQTGKGTVAPADLQKLILQQMLSSSKIVSLKSAPLEFYFNYGLHKEVKVNIEGNIVPAHNYYLAHAECKPDKVTVYADQETLDGIVAIPTEFLNIVNFDDTLTTTVRLKTAAGVKAVPAEVTVTLFPDILTEGSMQVPITTVNCPTGVTIRTFPQQALVKFSVGSKVYRLVRQADFQVYADYNEVVGHPSEKCTLHLKNNSRYAQNAKLETTQADYLIEQQ